MVPWQLQKRKLNKWGYPRMKNKKHTKKRIKDGADWSTNNIGLSFSQQDERRNSLLQRIKAWALAN